VYKRVVVVTLIGSVQPFQKW